MSDEITVLHMADSPLLPTGFANQSRNLCKRLALRSDFDVYYLAWQYTGMPIPVNFHLPQVGCKQGSFTMLPAGVQPFGQDVISPYINRYKPDVFSVLADTFMTPFLTGFDFNPAKFLFYFPSDGYPLPVGGEQVLRRSHVPIAMSKFAQKQALDEYGIDSKYIPHGVETNVFFEIENKKELREKWSKVFGRDLQDKFIVGSVGRFQGRKMLPELLSAFAKFAEDKPNAILLLHADPNDPANPMLNIFEIIKRLKIEGKVIWTGMKIYAGFSEKELREIYNLMDVHVLSTSGEGFGIPIIESQACGVPNILTNCTTTEELVVEPKTGIGVPVEAAIVGTYNVDRYLVSKKLFSEALDSVYRDENLLKSFKKNCRSNALLYDWDTRVFPDWLNLYREIGVL